MKIALCISGQPRGLQKNIPRLLEGLIKPSGIEDIFIHTWFDESLIGSKFNSAQPGQSGNIGAFAPDTVELLSSLNPKGFMYEAPKTFDDLLHLENLPSVIQTQIASNVYSVYMANKLKTEYEIANGFQYDLVIKTRIDINYYKPHNILDFLDNDWQNVLHVPYEYQYMRVNDSYPTPDEGPYSSLSDTFGYGSSHIVNIFSSIYPNFEYIYNNIKPYQYGECYFGYWVRKFNGIKISMQNIQYNLARD